MAVESEDKEAPFSSDISEVCSISSPTAMTTHEQTQHIPTLGEGNAITLGDGITLTLGKGNTLTLGEGNTLTLGEGNTLTLGEGSSPNHR